MWIVAVRVIQVEIMISGQALRQGRVCAPETARVWQYGQGIWGREMGEEVETEGKPFGCVSYCRNLGIYCE